MINCATWIVKTQWIPCAIGMEYLCLYKPYHLSPFYLTSIINLRCCEINRNITWRHRKKNSIITTPPILFMTNFQNIKLYIYLPNFSKGGLSIPIPPLYPLVSNEQHKPLQEQMFTEISHGSTIKNHQQG